MRSSGQIAVFTLLLGLLGLTVGLAVIGRSLTDLRQATVVSSGVRALSAAEAGIQYGLSRLASDSLPSAGNCNSPVAVDLSLSGIKSYTGDPATSGIIYQICSNSPDFASMPAVSVDDVFQIDLSNITAANVKSFAVLWKNPNASLEIIKIDKDDNVFRFPYNGVAVSATNGFASARPAADCVSSLCADSSYLGGSCTGIGEIVYNNNDKFLRFKPVYAATDVAICAQTAGNSPGRLGLVYYSIIAKATTLGGAVKRVQTYQISNALPAVFDNVFYSGADIEKSQ